MTLHLGIDIGVQGASTNPARFWGSTTCRRWPGPCQSFRARKRRRAGQSRAYRGAFTERRTPMTAHVLVAGTLFRGPAQRTSKTGKPFVTATILAKDWEAAQWWKVLAFSETVQSELMRLTDGDALSMQGALCGKSG